MDSHKRDIINKLDPHVDLDSVQIFAKVLYLQHYSNTECFDKEGLVLEIVAEVRS